MRPRFSSTPQGLARGMSPRSLSGLDPKTIPPRHLAKGNYFSMSGRAPFEHLIYPVPVAWRPRHPPDLRSRRAGAVRARRGVGRPTSTTPSTPRALGTSTPRSAATGPASPTAPWSPPMPASGRGQPAPGRRRKTSSSRAPPRRVIQAMSRSTVSNSPGLTASLAIGEYVAGLAYS